MKAVLPGMPFKVIVEGKEFDAVSLNGHKQLELARVWSEAAEAERSGTVLEATGKALECLTVCVGKDKADELFRVMNVQMAMDFIKQVYLATTLDEETEKN